MSLNTEETISVRINKVHHTQLKLFKANLLLSEGIDLTLKDILSTMMDFINLEEFKTYLLKKLES